MVCTTLEKEESCSNHEKIFFCNTSEKKKPHEQKDKEVVRMEWERGFVRIYEPTFERKKNKNPSCPRRLKTEKISNF